MVRTTPPPSFLDTLFGLLTDPASIANGLLKDRENPPYGGTLFLCLAITVFLPIAAQIYKYDFLVYRTDLIFALLTTFLVSLLFFVLGEFTFLRLIGIQIHFPQLLAISSYCLTPLMFVTWLFYGVNFFTQGKLTIATYLITGYGSFDDLFIRIVPIITILSQLFTMLVFYSCIRAVTEMEALTSFMVTIISILPAWTALIIGLGLSEWLFPGTLQVLIPLLTGFSSLFEFGPG